MLAEIILACYVVGVIALIAHVTFTDHKRSEPTQWALVCVFAALWPIVVLLRVFVEVVIGSVNAVMKFAEPEKPKRRFIRYAEKPTADEMNRGNR